MGFCSLFKKGKREANRSSCMLERGMLACLALMTVSSMLFVGTTLSWFTDQVSGGATVIQAGEMAVNLVLENPEAKGTKTIESSGNAINANMIHMTRVDKESSYWEPGAIFMSQVMHVENTGEIDLEYRLELITAKESIADGTDAEPASAEEEANLRLLDAIEFKIIDAKPVVNAMEAKSGSGPAKVIDGFFDPKYLGWEDMRKADLSALIAAGEKAADAEPETNPILTLKAAPEVATKSASPTKSSRFIIVGKMKDDAGNECKGMRLDAPFILVVRGQQAGSEWTDTPATVCTAEYHEQVRTGAETFADTEMGYWKFEKNGEGKPAHVYHCAICEQALSDGVEDANGAHKKIAKYVFDHDLDGSASVWTVVTESGTVDYYCRICNQRIATADGNTLHLYGGEESTYTKTQP